MSASEYICKMCKEVKSAGWILKTKRYKCPTHGVICPDCVNSRIVFKSKCKACDSKVVTYHWDRKKKKWMK